MNFGLVVLGAVGLALGLLVIHIVGRLASDWKTAARRRSNRHAAPS
jgi:hypothetical protein